MSQASVNVKLVATLKDNLGNPLTGASIAFSYRLSGAAQFSPGGSALTDSSGSASVVLALAAPDVYDFQAVFGGTPTYLASNGVITYDTMIPLAQSQLTIVLTQPVVSGSTASVTISGSLTSNQQAIPAATVAIAVDGAAVDSVLTDGAGNYGAVLTGLSLGKHTITASYAGSATVKPAQASSSVNFGGYASSSKVPIALVGAVAVAGVVIAVARKK